MGQKRYQKVASPTVGPVRGRVRARCRTALSASTRFPAMGGVRPMARVMIMSSRRQWHRVELLHPLSDLLRLSLELGVKLH